MARRSSSASTGRRPTSIPHSQYDYRSTMVVRAIYEGLVGLKGQRHGRVRRAGGRELGGQRGPERLDLQDPPESDLPGWLSLRQRGGESVVRANAGRWVAARSPSSPASSPIPTQMTTPDPATIVFDCGAPQPLFLTALSATYGPQIVNAKVGPGARRGRGLRQRLDAGSTPRALAPAAGNSSRSSRARRRFWSGTRTTGAAGKGITSSGSSSASSRRSRRCASSWKPATSTSWTASVSISNGSMSSRRTRRSTSIFRTAPK